MSVNLVWLRNDLRMDDNPALHYACETGERTQVIYIACPEQWQNHHDSPQKIAFWNQSLRDLQVNLAQSGISLGVLNTASYREVPAMLHQYCLNNGITDLWFNREYAINECMRDEKVEHKLKQDGIKCHSFAVDLLNDEPLYNQQGAAYRVFTPWYRAWIRELQNIDLKPLSAPGVNARPTKEEAQRFDFMSNACFREDLFPAAESAAQSRLQNFIQHRLQRYNDLRDFPCINSTSTLSPYLASGLLSARRCIYEIQQVSELNGLDWSVDPWIRQLGWREFYRYLMKQFPRLGRNRAFKEETETIRWEHNEQQITAWKQGETGFPIIDAGMRQLARTGWMHNRLRMLCASFFCKLMLSDWRLGERFFMQSLIDGDFANNNGGWQWSASTGCDASPWFRIFSPVRQSMKFDPDGKFIRQMVPELKTLDSKRIHQPSTVDCAENNYSQPILDYTTARQRALERFRKLGTS